MRSAVFVDDGYLYAQGSVALAGQKMSRAEVKLDLSRTIAKLREVSAEKTGDSPLLRIYWYDGLMRGELSADQQRVADTEDVKLRLGIVNWAGQQKGVDSLIVTDLVELARNHAITDAVLLSGDEDLRIGVQIAQSFGVRVHLIGIEPSRGSQSTSLLQEADTTTEWSRAKMCELLAIEPSLRSSDRVAGDAALPHVSGEVVTALEQTIEGFVSALSPEERMILGSLQEADMVPRPFDTKLLATCGTALGRNLDQAEKAQMRKMLRQAVRDRVDA